MLAALFMCAAFLQAADDFPEIRTLDGKLYKNVKVTKTSPAEIRIMHAEGFAVIPLSQLPEDVLTRFGGKVSKNAEMLAEGERELANIRARSSAVPVPSSTLNQAAPAAAPQPQQMTMDVYIASAIANRRMLLIGYENGAEGPRFVEPHLIGVTTQGHWAMLAWFREGASQSATGEGWRTYLLERITSIEMTAHAFAGSRPGYDPTGGGVFQRIAASLPGAVAAVPQAAVAPRVLAVDAIDGEFTGFEAGKKFKLMSGRVLQQVEGTYLYHYSYSPQITIYQTDRGALMQVQGLEQPVLVVPAQ